MDAPDPQFLKELAKARMPFGKYKDQLIVDLPEAYLVWWRQQGWPTGKLGQWLATAYEIRINGLDSLLAPFKNSKRTHFGAKA